MKNYKKHLLSIAMLSFLFLSCEDETAPENSIEIIDQVSMVEIAGVQMERKISIEVTHNANSAEKREVVGIEIGGNKLIKIDENEWYLDTRAKSNNQGQLTAKMEVSGLAGAECETTYFSAFAPAGLGMPAGCHSTVTTTCYSGYVDENGVLNGEISVTRNYSFKEGLCRQM